MTSNPRMRASGAMLLVVALTGALAACSTGAESDVTYMADDGTCAVAPSEGADFAAASAVIESYQQPITGLVETDPLPEPIEAGTQVAFLNNGTAVAAIMHDAVVPAAEAAGVELINVDTGTDAQSINSALDSVVSLAPDIVLAVALDASFFQDQLAELKDMGIPVVYGSQPNAEEFGLDDTLGGYNASLENGRVLASGAIAFTCGTGDSFVFYNMPELAFSTIVQDETAASLAELCPECELRFVDISVTDPSPADAIVSDLQAHPETDYFITPGDQYQVGLAAKAELAGLTNAYGFGQSSLPPNIQQLIDGTQHAGFAVDLDMYMWLLLDEGLRKAQGVWEPYSDWPLITQSVSRVLTHTNAAEFSDRFVAYEGMEADFATLWHTS